MRIALAQLEIEAGAVEHNVDSAIEAIRRAGSDSADLVVLPELFTVGYFAFDLYARHAESVAGETIGRLANAARDTDTAVLAGSIVEDLAASAADGIDVPQSSGLANASVFLGPEGDRRGTYRKHHLFGYDSAESSLLEPGERVDTVEFGGFTVGMTTCYDLRFPELYRRLVDEGATLVCVPSAWPYPRVEHWELFGQARAVENQLYVAAANGVGSFEDAELLGRSTVYDPWGTVLASSADEPALVTAELDPDRVERVREGFPALADRRTDWG
ncbi:carbon-nitrogen family hydrolase [Haloarcula montana]|uniref:carbon-nitrogen family hydrolase n=1 Tax=Haloarcula montana TaxID=3111776 RepID=UPI002D7820B1|nr:carbon-nitrogen family hydrolase [Haloarcula sp. GH36]